MKAFLGVIGAAALVLVPLIAILIFGARSGRKSPATMGNWTKTLKANPTGMAETLHKIRPK